jgi:hypothetical protein
MKIIPSQVFKILPPIALKTPYLCPHVVCKTFSQCLPQEYNKLWDTLRDKIHLTIIFMFHSSIYTTIVAKDKNQ